MEEFRQLLPANTTLLALYTTVNAEGEAVIDKTRVFVRHPMGLWVSMLVDVVHYKVIVEPKFKAHHITEDRLTKFDTLAACAEFVTGLLKKYTMTW